MSTVTTKVLAPVAVDALGQAVMDGAAYSWWEDRPCLAFYAGSEALTRALLAVLTEVRAEDWDGPESGDGLRTYCGVLPCGLRVKILTYRDEVPDLLPFASKPQADLDTKPDRNDTGRGEQ